MFLRVTEAKYIKDFMIYCKPEVAYYMIITPCHGAMVPILLKQEYLRGICMSIIK